jgi:uridine phosphorylase
VKPLPETDLILNPDGSVYHLGLKPEHVADTVIAVGDPERVEQVSRHFQKVEFRLSRREFVTHVGIHKGRKVTVLSTGIGTDNVEIVFQELDALVNVDLASRQLKEKRSKLAILRIGTSGSLQPEIPVDSHLVSVQAAGLDNLIAFYQFPQSEQDAAQGKAIQQCASLSFAPYISHASLELVGKFGTDMVQGFTITSPGFFAPQGRQISLPLRYPRLLDDLRGFDYKGRRLTNFEMETAAYYALSTMMGHEALSLNAIIGNRAMGKFSSNPRAAVDALIEKVLGRLS